MKGGAHAGVSRPGKEMAVTEASFVTIALDPQTWLRCAVSASKIDVQRKYQVDTLHCPCAVEMKRMNGVAQSEKLWVGEKITISLLSPTSNMSSLERETDTLNVSRL